MRSRSPSVAIAVVAVMVAAGSTPLLLPSAHADTPAGPDLWVCALTVEPANITAEDTARFEGRVCNDGTAAAGPSEVAVVLNGNETLGSMYVPALGAGNATNVTWYWSAWAGEHSVTFTADATGNVSETNETNNAASAAFEVGDAPLRPDLKVRFATASTYEPVEGQGITIGWAVRNSGAAPAGASYLKAYVRPTWQAESPYVPPLAVGEEVTVYATSGWLPVGTAVFTAHADSSDDVRESNEGNNWATRSMQVKHRPDLDVDISVTRATIQTDVAAVTHPAAPFEVRIDLCNRGEGPARNARVDVTVESPGLVSNATESGPRLIGHAGFPYLPSGSCGHRTLLWQPDGVIGDVTFRASARAAQPEWTYTNNADAADAYVFVGGLGGVMAPAAPA